MNRRTFYFLLIMEIGAILRVFWLGSTPFWYDEAFSYLVARLPFTRMIEATIYDVHPPMYYILAKPFASIPWQPGGLRLISVLCSLGSIWLIWLISGRMSMTNNARLIATALMAVWPSQLYYAQEGRMYAMLQLLVLGAWLAILERRWVVSAVLAALAMYTHNYGVIYAALIGAIGVMHEAMRPRTWYAGHYRKPETHEAQAEYVVIAFAAALIAWLPWGWVIINQIAGARAGGGYWLNFLTLGSLLRQTANILITPQSSGITDPPSVILMAAGIPVLLWFAMHKRMYALLTLGIAPMIIMAVISILWSPVYLHRGFLPSVPFILLLLSCFLEELTTIRKAFALGLLIPAMAGAFIVWLSSNAYGVRTMSVNYASGVNINYDATIIHTDTSSWIVWMAALPDVPQRVLVNHECDHDPGALTDGTLHALFVQFIDPSDLPDRYYLVVVNNTFTSQCNFIRSQRFSAGLENLMASDFYFGSIGVYRYGYRSQ